MLRGCRAMFSRGQRGVVRVPKVKVASVAEVDAFCGPCFHNAIEHPVADGRREPLCWECPGSKRDYGSQPGAWWDGPQGDPSLEAWSCPRCREADAAGRRD
jgi:hypothetical protein